MLNAKIETLFEYIVQISTQKDKKFNKLKLHLKN